MKNSRMVLFAIGAIRQFHPSETALKKISPKAKKRLASRESFV
jgi:hypothetical protein